MQVEEQLQRQKEAEADEKANMIKAETLDSDDTNMWRRPVRTSFLL